MTKIALIGIGNLGSAIAGNLIDDFEKENIILCDKNVHCLEEFESVKCVKTEEAGFAAKNVDVVILAVKPQTFTGLGKVIRANISENTLIISVMAGVEISYITEALGVKNVVRVMPNIPLKLKKGVIAYYAQESVVRDFHPLINKILGGWGTTIEVNSEDKLDKITALSGSGPAYFYLLAKVMVDKAVKMGFDKDQANKIVRGTFIGSAAMIEMTGSDFEDEIYKVASKGGTTEAALKFFEISGFGEIVDKAVEEAYKRSKEL
ncbi:pyrroline-5-carboxylate reductase [Patescibacteria group bacterium]|nr:pyrroline-5-carboxylate reductase [Patescibacteria group bacterium]